MKKLLAFLTAFSLIISVMTCPSFIVSATGNPEIVVSKANGAVGETVVITLSVVNNPGIRGIVLDISYDRSRLQLVKVTDSGKYGVYTTSQYITDHPYRNVWTNNYVEGNMTEDCVLATCEFKVIAAGPADITVDSGGSINNILNAAYQPVICDFIGGGVNLPPSDVISLDVTWGAMEFTYTDAVAGTWNPETHEYDGATPAGWSTDEVDGNKITVENNGTVNLDVTFSYTKTEASVSGGFTDGTNADSGAVPLDVGDKKSVYLVISGTPDSTAWNKTKIGTVTVSVVRR